MGLYDLDMRERKLVASTISACFRSKGCRKVPTYKDEFVEVYLGLGINDSLDSMLVSRGIDVNYTPQEAYELYDDVMR